MQKIGDSTATANGAGEFTQGQPGSGIDATMITAAWLNAVQRELASVVTGAGLTLNPTNDAQVLQAIRAIQEKEIQRAVAALVDSSPATLDTLHELAQALGNDPNFATTMTSALAGKASKATTLAGYGIDIATQAEAEAQADQDNAKPMTPLRVFQAIAKRVVQATETAFGWAKVATQGQTNSGVDDTAFVTPKKFSAGIAALVIQATETVRGIAKVATLTQTGAGTDDTVFITPWKLRWGFAISLATNGYIAFPMWLGGIIVQWGSATAVNGSVLVTFPMAFPTACLLTPQMTTTSSAAQWLSWSAGNLTRTGFSGYCGVSYSIGSLGGGTFSWWAVGY